MKLYRIDICDNPHNGLQKRIYERGSDENSLRDKYAELFPNMYIFIYLVKIMLETLGKMRDAFGVLYHASELIVAHAFGEYAADHAPPPPQPYQSGNGFQEIVSEPAIAGKTVAEIIEEVKKLIIELQIKGTVREHRNGLLKFTSPVFGCVYGRSEEEFRQKLTAKITQLAKHPQKAKQKTAKAKSPLLSEYFDAE